MCVRACRSTTDADLSIDMQVDDDDPVVGSSVTFTVTVINKGQTTATGVSVAHVLEGGLTAGTVTGPCAGGTLPCGLSDVPSGQSATYSVDVSVSSAADALVSLRHTATVSTTATDSESGNDVSLVLVSPRYVCGGGRRGAWCVSV